MSESPSQRIEVSLTFSVSMAQEGGANTTSAPNAENELMESHEVREERLVEALLADREAFDRIVVRRVAVYLEQVSWEEWHKLLLGELVGDEELLAPVIVTLAAEDRAYYAPSEEEFIERTEGVRARFIVQIEQVVTHVGG